MGLAFNPLPRLARPVTLLSGRARVTVQLLAALGWAYVDAVTEVGQRVIKIGHWVIELGQWAMVVVVFFCFWSAL